MEQGFQQLPPPEQRLGDMRLLAFNDGQLPTSLDVTTGISVAECERLAGLQRDEMIWISVNQYVVRASGKIVLIDAGGGTSMHPRLGLLPQNLRAAGLDPLRVDVVLLTHLHGDHMQGLVDEKGTATFPNAELFLHEREAAFWIKREPSGNPRIDNNLPHVRRSLEPYANRLRRVNDGEAISGFRALLCPGHTPGHTSWILESEGQSAIMWGDLVHLASVQLPRPEVGVIYDLDPELAVQSRQRILDMCASDGLLVLGAHLAYPGFARITREGRGFRAQPVA